MFANTAVIFTKNALHYGAAPIIIAVSYTHLDVYKRQVLLIQTLSSMPSFHQNIKWLKKKWKKKLKK